jgi:hypothetical protein
LGADDGFGGGLVVDERCLVCWCSAFLGPSDAAVVSASREVAATVRTNSRARAFLLVLGKAIAGAEGLVAVVGCKRERLGAESARWLALASVWACCLKGYVTGA